MIGAFEPILAALGGALTAVALIAQYRTAGAVALRFSAEDWQEDGKEWVLRIPAERHGCRNPTASVGKQTEHGWAEVITDPYVEEDGTVAIRIARREDEDTRFACEVRIS